MDKSIWVGKCYLKKPVYIKENINLPNLKIWTSKTKFGKKITDIVIETPELERYKAEIFVMEQATKIVDFLSFIQRTKTQFEIKELKQKKSGKLYTFAKGFRCLNFGTMPPQLVDLTSISFKKILVNKDKKLMRQIAHYNKSLEADIGDIFRYSYIILEDEYDKNSNKLKNYRWIRNVLSHPEITNLKQLSNAKQKLNKSHIIPTNLNDLQKINGEAIKINQEARKIIQKKLNNQ